MTATDPDGAAEPDGKARVAICALTYLRPEGLRQLLDGIAELEVPEGVTVATIIVDNDPDASARDHVTSRAPSFPHELLYVNEPARGISHARNAAVAAARDCDADMTCFVDDDEWPDPAWLVELLATRAATGAPIVTGPVIPVFEEDPPAWAVEGEFFERRRHEHHERIRYATTSTVLIDRECLEGRPAPFDPAFGMSGGEDTHLFAQLYDDGFEPAWCDRAIVYETIPASRVDPRWILRREYRRGQTLSLSLRKRDQSAVRLVRRIGNGTLHVLAGAGELLLALPRGKAAQLGAQKEIVFGAGMLTGLVGRRYEEYETIHGS